MHTNTWFTFLWIILSTYSAVFWRLCHLQWYYSGWWDIPKNTYMGLHRFFCLVVNLLLFAVLMMCGMHGRHCCSQYFGFFCSYFIILEHWLWRYYYLFVNCYFVFYACSVTWFFFLLVTGLEYILILINSHRGSVSYVVRLYFWVLLMHLWNTWFWLGRAEIFASLSKYWIEDISESLTLISGL